MNKKVEEYLATKREMQVQSVVSQDKNFTNVQQFLNKSKPTYLDAVSKLKDKDKIEGVEIRKL